MLNNNNSINLCGPDENEDHPNDHHHYGEQQEVSSSRSFPPSQHLLQPPSSPHLDNLPLFNFPYSKGSQSNSSLPSKVEDVRKKRANSIANGNIPRIKLWLLPEEGESEGESKDIFPVDGPSPKGHQRLTKLRFLPLDKTKLSLSSRPRQDRRPSLPGSMDSLSSESSFQINFLSKSRKLSMVVTQVVTQQIESTIQTIGNWTSPKCPFTEEEVMEQGRRLVARFVFFRLRKSGLCHKRFHLQRLRAIGTLDESVDDLNRNLPRVFMEIRSLVTELERHHPKTFSSVLNNVGPTPFKSVQAVTKAQRLIADCLLGEEITWTHVAALFSITAALAVDSARMGKEEYVNELVDGFAKLAGKDLSYWICGEGGWDSLINKYRQEDEWQRTLRWIVGSFLVVVVGILMYFMIF